MTPEERLLAHILDNSPLDEPYHERDCFACDVADEVIGALGAYWNEDDAWFTTPSPRRPHITLAVEASRIAAHVLHRRLGMKQLVPPQEASDG